MKDLLEFPKNGTDILNLRLEVYQCASETMLHCNRHVREIFVFM